ncbi:MAG TPA: T9SS type A sorting domain-containing protein [Candidatus Acidoferrales bacterium]|nr:T9SS type A sorting domain-containing protein [Candidatus Acidoferrales bacterium]
MKIRNTLFIVSVLISAIASIEARAQTADEIYRKFSKSYHTYNGVTLPFYFFVPAGYNSASKYPLVLCLHGAGERGDDSTAVEKNSMATVWAQDTNQIKWPCFILVPQCPITGSWVYLYGPGSYSTNAIPISAELLNVLDIMDSLIGRYSVDTNRVYVTGLSMGGFGTWDLIVRFPDKFAAAVPMSGAGDTSKAEVIKDIPVWDFHGALDGTVPVSGSREMMHSLEEVGDEVVYTNCGNGSCTGLSDSAVAAKIQNGARHLYTEYQYGSHTIWDVAYNDPFLLPWVFSQSKADRPNAIRNPATIPDKVSLSQNYPNPFNPTTEIDYRLSTGCRVTLKLYDVLGREIRTLVDQRENAGSYTVEFDASQLSTGVYLVILRANGYLAVRKISLIK